MALVIEKLTRIRRYICKLMLNSVHTEQNTFYNLHWYRHLSYQSFYLHQHTMDVPIIVHMLHRWRIQFSHRTILHYHITVTLLIIFHCLFLLAIAYADILKFHRMKEEVAKYWINRTLKSECKPNSAFVYFRCLLRFHIIITK